MRRLPGWAPAVAATSAVVLAAVAALAGVSLWVPVIALGAVWVWVLAPRLGGIAASAAVAPAVGVGVLALLLATAALRVPPLPLLMVTIALAAGSALLVHLRAPETPRAPERGRLGVTAAAWLSALLWPAVLLVAHVLPGAAPNAWVMNGDSANNILFARRILDDDGIVAGAGENPVPIPAALIALGMAAGRAQVGAGELLRHDVEAFSHTWTIVIALVCGLTALVVASAVPERLVRTRVVAAVLGGLLPVSWYVVGYPIEYGFFNTHVALIFVLSAWLWYTHGVRTGGGTLLVPLLAATSVLAVWSPVVVVPLALAAAATVRDRASWRRPRRRDLALGAIGAVQFAAFGLGFVLPSLLQQGGALGAVGGVYPISRWVFLGLAAGLVVLAVVLRRTDARVAIGAVAVAVAATVGYAVLLFAARGSADPWTSYYPSKYSWLAGVVLFIIGAALILKVVSALRVGVLRVAAFIVVACAAAGFGQIATWTNTGYERDNPALRVLRGDLLGDGEAVTARIFAAADTSRPTVYWDSGDPAESTIDFWVLQMQAQSSDNERMRVLAYSAFDLDDVRELCEIAELAGSPLRVVSRQTDLAARLGASCPGSEIDVVESAG